MSVTHATPEIKPVPSPFAAIGAFFDMFIKARRFKNLFAMDDRQLAAHGLDRDMLVRSYISSLGHS